MTSTRFSFDPDRARAAAGVALCHGLIGWALIAGLGVDVAGEAARTLNVFDVAAPPAPPPEPLPAEKTSDAPEGEAAPPDLRARPSPVIAPPPAIRLDVPPPVTASREPAPVPLGPDPTSGAAELPGPGSGAGGVGAGTGSGGQGRGSGGGGFAIRAVRVEGQLVDADYPRRALRDRAQGSVAVRFTVGIDGRAGNCRVIASSGHEALDATTCRLIERRFRYRPARDAAGQPTAETVSTVYDWILPVRS